MIYRPRQEEGQGCVEYAIVLVVLVIVGAVIVFFVSPIVGGILEDVGDHLK